MKNTNIDMDTGIPMLDGTVVYTRHGDYFDEHMKSVQYGGDMDETEVLMRTDLVKPGGDVYGQMFLGIKEYDTCSLKNYTKEDYEAKITETLMYVGHKMEYDGVKKGVYHGKSCKVYYSVEKIGTIHCYATEDNYVLKVEVLMGVFPGSSSSSSEQADDTSSSSSSSSSTTSTSTSTSSSSIVPTGIHQNVTYAYEYNFDEVPLSAFDFSESVTESCDKRAYEPPTKKLCPDHSSSSSGGHQSSAGSKGSSGHTGMASSAKVTVAVLIASIAAALISLF